ncbi:MAG TPA: DNA gyrase inhibitor YacG [Fluviicoccus sp.]|nr:DNA gyrase inhibitor YacG [Fluviicoccus sp.]
MPEPSPSTPAVFPCPRCGQPSRWQDNPFRPFCCERCKLIDLGGWAAESYRIPVASARDFEDGSKPDSE